MERKFIFKGYEAELYKGVVLFHYRLETSDKTIDFTESISFPSDVSQNIPSGLFTSVSDNIFLILGISYWKLYCPKKIELESLELSKQQADFWNTVYTKGLGEFFYQNKIDFRGLVEFPYTNEKQTTPTSFPRKNRSLVPLGGGKDSIVTVELLKKYQKEFDLLTVETSDIQKAVADVIGKDPIVIERTIDPKLFGLNTEKDTYNGHIPISVVYAFLSLLAAVLYDYRYVIVSNEKSANYGNVEYLNMTINHQWSKSLEFEQLFQNYIKESITPDIIYFSLLRPFHEIKITELFSHYPKYFPVFSSCNRNFIISKKHSSGKWCGRCPKCAFVFSLLAAFLPKQEVINIFSKNLLDDAELVSLYKELLGIKDFKPFECVGTPEEMQLALYLAYQRGEFDNEILMELFKEEVLPQLSNPEELKKHLFEKDKNDFIPTEFKEIIVSV